MREDATGLWTQYLSCRSQENRNALVLHYSTLVRYVASKMPSNAISTVERDDLISYGTFGLLDAIAKFDPDKGVKFETYAITRIRGAIIDEIRSFDWVPRSVRAKAKEIERVYIELETKLGRPGTDAEVAGRLNITIAELHALKSQTSVSLTHMDEHTDDDERASVRDLLVDVSSNPEELYVSDEIAQMLSCGIGLLPHRLQVLLVLTYVHEMTLAQIGEVLGVTESRVSQLQSKMLVALRDAVSRELSMAATTAA